MESALMKQVSFMIEDWVPKEASIAVAVENRYVYMKEGSIALNIRQGDHVQAGSIAAMVGREEKRVEKLVEDPQNGIAYYGIGYPVSLNGKQAVIAIMLPPAYFKQKKQPLRFLTGKLEDVWRPVPIDCVSHIESSQKKTWFYAEEEMYCSIHTLKMLKEQLPDSFMPVHRSYIVNIHFIAEITRDLASNYIITMKDGSILPISQNYTASVRERLGF